MQASASASESVTKLVPGGAHHLAHLSDSELLANTRRLVGSSNQMFAALLLHLAEVETRGIHRERACASLYAYCVYELHMSEDSAARRSSAARLVKKFPLVLDAVARGELHLTGLVMLAPHLTPENHVEVLARAKFRTKKEIAKLVRGLHPLPRVPDVDESFKARASPPDFIGPGGIRSLDQELYPDFDDLRRERALTDDALTAWASELTPQRLAAPLVYNRLGQRHESPLWWAVAHVFNHQTHHRGQITTLLMQQGRDPGVTDLFAMLRQEATQASAR